MENSKKFTVSTGEILYWFFFGALFFAKGMGFYDGQTVFKFVLVFACLCLLGKLAIEKYTVSEIIRIIVTIGLAGFTYAVSGEKGMLLYSLMMVGMKYVDVKRLFAIGTVLWMVAFLGVAITSLFHMEDTVYKVHAKLGMGHIFRWSLGYPHPNVLHISYIVLVLLIIYTLGEHFRIKHAAYMFIGNCIIFLYSVSYTGFLVFMCLISGRIYLFFRKRLNKAEKMFLQLIFPVCVIISLVFPLIASGKVFEIVNKILSTRLALAKYYLTPEFISLFGKRVSEITSHVLTMDNAYLFAFITYGIIPFVILCVATIWMIYRLTKEEKYLEVLITLVIAIAGLTEPFLYNTSFKNLSFIFMGVLLFGKRKKESYCGSVQFQHIKNLNKTIIVNVKHLMEVKDRWRRLFRFSKRKMAAGIFCAVLAALIVGPMISYPEGYVVYRIDCADISEEMHYYEKDAVELNNYKEMADFQPGDEIECFSGNIIIMEKIRNYLLILAVGYIVGYIGSAFLLKEKSA